MKRIAQRPFYVLAYTSKVIQVEYSKSNNNIQPFTLQHQFAKTGSDGGN
jgi:hypothetical protein